VIRTRPPALRTLPSSTWLTSNSRATSGTFTLRPLKVKAVLRAMTPRAETFERSVMMSSLIPSLKYSCCGSSLMLANGRTQMLARCADRGRVGSGAAAACAPPRTRSAIESATFFQPALSMSPLQPARSAHWMRSNGIGSGAPSTLIWTSLRSVRARSAPDCTHSDLAASADQITTTALAAFNRSSMTSENERCAGSSSSRQTL
jgi:hypothetical protein